MTNESLWVFDGSQIMGTQLDWNQNLFTNPSQNSIAYWSIMAPKASYWVYRICCAWWYFVAWWNSLTVRILICNEFIYASTSYFDLFTSVAINTESFFNFIFPTFGQILQHPTPLMLVIWPSVHCAVAWVILELLLAKLLSGKSMTSRPDRMSNPGGNCFFALKT